MSLELAGTNSCSSSKDSLEVKTKTQLHIYIYVHIFSGVDRKHCRLCCWRSRLMIYISEIAMFFKTGKYKYLFVSLMVSGRNRENPTFWLVPGAGSIFLSPVSWSRAWWPTTLSAEWSCELKERSFETWQKNKHKSKNKTKTLTKTNYDKTCLFHFSLIISPTF